MSQQKVTYSGGISLVGLLGVAFVILKLCGVITWSWWLVLLPFYGGLALILAILLIIVIFIGVGAIGSAIFKSRRA